MKCSFDDLCDLFNMIVQGLNQLGKDVYQHMMYKDVVQYLANDSYENVQNDSFDPY